MSKSARLIVVASMAAVSLGCEGPIFATDKPRSQFGQLQRVRNMSEPSHLPDEFGTLRPNLTGRLSGLK